MLEELAVDYERVLVDVRDATAERPPGFVAASPFRKVPALEDGDVKMADSAAICLYLADRYPARELAPDIADPRRGRYLFWMTFVPGALEPAVSERLSGKPTNTFGAGWGDYDRMLLTLENGLDPGPWLLGDQFSAADVMVGGTLLIMDALGLRPDSQRLKSYADRCIARPHCKTAEALEIALRDPHVGTGRRRRGRP